MTEPPEPRRPEEGGGEEDYDASWDSIDADGLLDGLEDDALLDSIRDGVRGDLGPDELGDLLAGLRDVPDKLDIPMKNTSRVERGEDVLPPPRQTSEGSAPNMLSESLAALNQVAQDTSAAGPLTEAKGDLENSALGKLMQAVSRIADMNTQALGAMSGNTNDEQIIGSAGEHAANAIEEAIDAVNAAIQAVSLAVDHEASFRNTVASIAAKHSGS